MRKNEDTRKNNSLSIGVNVILGSVVGLLIAMILLLVLSIFISSGRIPESIMEQLVIGCVFLGSFIGSATAIKKHGGRSLIVGTAVGIVFFLLTLVFGAFSSSDTMIGAMTLSVLIAALAGGVFAGVLDARRKPRKKIRG